MQRNEIYNRTTGRHGERIYTVSEIEAIVGIGHRAAAEPTPDSKPAFYHAD